MSHRYLFVSDDLESSSNSSVSPKEQPQSEPRREEAWGMMWKESPKGLAELRMRTTGYRSERSEEKGGRELEVEIGQEEGEVERIYMEDAEIEQTRPHVFLFKTLKEFDTIYQIPLSPDQKTNPHPNSYKPSPYNSSYTSTLRRPGKYNMLTASQKRQIVEQSFRSSLSHSAKIYNVSVNNICRWRNRCDRKSGAGRKVHDPTMETRLLEWIVREKGGNGNGQLTRQMIRTKAQELSKSNGFKASKGWYERFVTRNREVIRMDRRGENIEEISIEETR